MPNKAMEDYNLAVIHPLSIDFWDYEANDGLSPDLLTPSSGKKVWWVRECNTDIGLQRHKWDAPVDWMAKNGFKCPYCSTSNARVLKGFNDLETLYPNIAKEWDYSKNGNLKPDDILSKASKKVWWVKECVPNNPYGTHSWKTSIRHRTADNTGCNVCSSRVVLSGFNDLATQYPDIAKEWHPIKNSTRLPTEFTPYVMKKAWWLAECGHEWESAIASRTKENRGCPTCVNQKVLAGFNDLATMNPELAKKWSPNNIVKPTEVTQFTHKKFLWNGECGHEWLAMVSDMSTGRGCPFCAGRQIILGFNDLASQFPEIAKEWHPTKNNKTPEEFSKASERKVWWQCNKGHEYQAWINIRTHQNTGCPYCKNRKLLVGFNDLASVSPHLARELSSKNDFDASEVIATSGRRVIWECDKGHEWKQQIDVRQRGIDCPECYSRTSKSESLLREAFRPVLKNVNKSHTYKLDIEGIKYKKQVDIFGELKDGRKIIIEYDGWYWHREKVEKDTSESLAMLNAGYMVVRVREHSGSKILEHISIDDKNFLSLSAKHINSEETAQFVVTEVLHWLNS